MKKSAAASTSAPDRLDALVGALLQDSARSCASRPDDRTCPAASGTAWMLGFDRGILRIHNPWRLQCDSGESVEMAALTGCRVTDAYQTDAALVLLFEGRISLSISLNEEDYVTAEAASFECRSGYRTILG